MNTGGLTKHFIDIAKGFNSKRDGRTWGQHEAVRMWNESVAAYKIVVVYEHRLVRVVKSAARIIRMYLQLAPLQFNGCPSVMPAAPAHE